MRPPGAGDAHQPAWVDRIGAVLSVLWWASLVLVLLTALTAYGGARGGYFSRYAAATESTCEEYGPAPAVTEPSAPLPAGKSIYTLEEFFGPQPDSPATGLLPWSLFNENDWGFYPVSTDSWVKSKDALSKASCQGDVRDSGRNPGPRSC